MKQLLVEKYRPKTINDYVFQRDEIKMKVEKWIKDGEIPNLLLTSSSPGSGKSSLSRILVTELGIDSSDVKYVNASLVSGIGFIREELEPWMKKKSFSKFKIVQLEECDRLSDAAQKALRGVVEDYSDKVRFIATANYPKKIIPALLSRFQHLEMDEFDIDNIIEYAITVAEREGLIINSEFEFMSHIEAYAPDLRKILNSIDEHTDQYNVLHPLAHGSGSSDGLDAWENAWATGDISLDMLLPLTEGVDQNTFELYYQCVYENSAKVENQGSLVVLCSEYLDRAYRCANQRLHLDAMLYEFFSQE